MHPYNFLYKGIHDAYNIIPTVKLLCAAVPTYFFNFSCFFYTSDIIGLKCTLQMSVYMEGLQSSGTSERKILILPSAPLALT